METIKGYQPVDSYVVAAVLFFVVAHVLSYVARRLSWRSHFYYFIGAISVFFPLVTIATIIQIHLGISSEDYARYITEYCAPAQDFLKPVETVSQLCGKAFAYIVYSMAMRALPIVLTIPFLYHLLLVDIPRILAKRNA